ncbi:MAG: hypothetical protein NXH91_11810 [Phyllobacteriaceae bacterium]|nr:hypothetical protein [Phyllobacteriaceae bacterium]
MSVLMDMIGERRSTTILGQPVVESLKEFLEALPRRLGRLDLGYSGWSVVSSDGVQRQRRMLTGRVGQRAGLKKPHAGAIGDHVKAGSPLFTGGTSVKMQAKVAGRTLTAAMRTNVRDQRSRSGKAAPAAWYRFTPDGRGEHCLPTVETSKDTNRFNIGPAVRKRNIEELARM